MTVRASLSLCISASSGPVENKDLGFIERSDKFTNYSESSKNVDTVLAGAVNQLIALGGLTTCEILALVIYPVDQNQTPSTLNIRRNLITAEEIAIKPIGPRKQGFLVLTTTGLTSLFVSNPGTTAMRVEFLSIGS